MGRRAWYYNWGLSTVVLLIALFGLAVLLTVSPSLFWQQAVYLAVGILLFFVASSIPSFLYLLFSPFLYIAGCILLALSYLGPQIRGATRWLIIGGVQLQPSELAKPLILLGFSYFMMRYPPKTLKHIILHVALFSVPFFLVFRQPDLGSSIIYFVMWLSMMIASGFHIWIVGIGIGVFALMAPFLWRILAPFQQSRILTFVDPELDPSGVGYNAIQSIIAVGSGQWFGRGLGLGTQSHLRFLPEFHTDFIFATLVEELGFAGATLLLVLYSILLWQILRPYLRRESDDLFTFIFSVGLFMMLLSQIAINTGMNMGIVPITGITLPLVSYGGSSLLSLLSTCGILSSLYRRKDDTPSHVVMP